MRVLVADDAGLFRAGLANLLEARGHVVVGQARDGFEALEQARRLRPDLVLMDVCMPRCTGLEATRLIRTELPEISIVLVAAASEGGELLETLRSGVAGCLLKEQPVEELTRVLDEVAALSRNGCETPLGKET